MRHRCGRRRVGLPRRTRCLGAWPRHASVGARGSAGHLPRPGHRGRGQARLGVRDRVAGAGAAARSRAGGTGRRRPELRRQRTGRREAAGAATAAARRGRYRHARAGDGADLAQDLAVVAGLDPRLHRRRRPSGRVAHPDRPAPHHDRAGPGRGAQSSRSDRPHALAGRSASDPAIGRSRGPGTWRRWRRGTPSPSRRSR